jgi:translocator protein
MIEERRNRLRPSLISGMAAIGVAALGGSVSDIGPWYFQLTKPDWNPPNAAFGIIWTLIFTLCAISGAMAWFKVREKRQGDALIGTFALNGFLNVLWSLLCFRLHRLDWAMIEVVFLWFSIVAMIIVAGRLSRLAGWLLVPYLIWVSIASYLNWELLRMNGPLG